ncbi:MAG: uracil phosphoribosyltransferase [Desulfobacteraceae bacterium]|nr:MAG: uracil phosphoribosyltransferase [Desulfobacteraceae bacterium]
MNNFILVDNPLVKVDVTRLRDKNTREDGFRNSIKRISYALALEISKEFELEEFPVETPLEKTVGHGLRHPVVLVPVLRAGLSMVSAFFDVMPDAKVGHIGLQRDEKTLQPIDYYYKTPKELEKAKVILLDPMLATGGSASAAMKYLKARGARNCLFGCLIAAPEGIRKMEADHPEVKIFSAVLDRGLNEKGYIVPGVGDAGDRTYGTL